MNSKPSFLYLVSLTTVTLFTLKMTYDVFTGLDMWKSEFPSQPRTFSRRNGIPCKNTDFSPQHKRAVYTLLTDDPHYILSALKLAHALRLHTTDEQFDMVVMEIESKPLGSTAWRCLQEMGWKRCVVDFIQPLDEAGTRTRYPRFVNVFTKLHVWGMTMYQTLVFLDADTLVLRSISHLLKRKLGNKSIAASAQTWYGVFQDFNTGVFVIHPTRDEYERLLRLQQDLSIQFDTVWGDQGFLNVVYKDKWSDLGFTNNALAWVSWQNHDYWLHRYAHINIIHFTGLKPWVCFPGEFIHWLISPSAYYTQICKVWNDMPPQTCVNR